MRALEFHVGDAVRKLRRSHHLTIPDLAKLAKVSTQTLSAIEGGAELRVSSLERIAHALGLAGVHDFDLFLDACAEQRIGPGSLKPEWREVIALWERICVSPPARESALWALRREADLATLEASRNLAAGAPVSAPAPHQPRTRRELRPRSKTNNHSTARHSGSRSGAGSPPRTTDAPQTVDSQERAALPARRALRTSPPKDPKRRVPPLNDLPATTDANAKRKRQA